jgi:hypothetical protein
MPEILSGVKGKFILSIYNHPRMRKTFEGFNISPGSV